MVQITGEAVDDLRTPPLLPLLLQDRVPNLPIQHYQFAVNGKCRTYWALAIPVFRSSNRTA
jgi:hypothetical protein